MEYTSYGQIYGSTILKVFGFNNEVQKKIKNIPDFVAFPYNRYPNIFFPLNIKYQIPWSFTIIEDKSNLQGNKYSYFSNAVITITDKNTNRQLPVSNFYFNTDDVGVPNVLTWYVNNWEYNRWYKVNIDNIKLKNSNTKNFTYDVYIDSEFPAYYVAEARTYLYNNPDNALQLLNNAITLSPNFAAAYNGRGDVYHYSGDYNKAIADYNKAIQLKQDYTLAYNGRGATYYDSGNYNEALYDYNIAIQLDPAYSSAYYNRGLVYYDTGNYNQAIADYNKAIQLSPDFALAYNNRGLVYAFSGDYNQAIADYTKAIQLDPDFSLAYYNRGLVYVATEQTDLAQKDFNIACSLNASFCH